RILSLHDALPIYSYIFTRRKYLALYKATTEKAFVSHDWYKGRITGKGDKAISGNGGARYEEVNSPAASSGEEAEKSEVGSRGISNDGSRGRKISDKCSIPSHSLDESGTALMFPDRG